MGECQPNRDIPVFKVKREDDQGKERVLYRNLFLPIGSKLTSPVPAPRIRKKKTEETEVEESIHNQEESDDDSIYLTAEYPESAECLEGGSREDAPNQNTEASDDPDTISSSSSRNSSSISGVLDDTQDEIQEDDDADDDDDQNIPRRSARVRQKPK
nr:nucleolin-like [Crassostrea gigas]